MSLAFRSSQDVAAACPDILDTAEQAISTRAQIVAETSLIIRTRSREREKENWSVMRPFDAPFIRALQRAPQETLSPRQRHKDIERAKTGIRRAYEERYLCEPTGNQRPCVAQQCQGRFPIRENASC